MSVPATNPFPMPAAAPAEAVRGLVAAADPGAFLAALENAGSAPVGAGTQVPARAEVTPAADPLAAATTARPFPQATPASDGIKAAPSMTAPTGVLSMVPAAAPLPPAVREAVEANSIEPLKAEPVEPVEAAFIEAVGGEPRDLAGPETALQEPATPASGQHQPISAGDALPEAAAFPELATGVEPAPSPPTVDKSLPLGDPGRPPPGSAPRPLVEREPPKKDGSEEHQAEAGDTVPTPPTSGIDPATAQAAAPMAIAFTAEAASAPTSDSTELERKARPAPRARRETAIQDQGQSPAPALTSAPAPASALGVALPPAPAEAHAPAVAATAAAASASASTAETAPVAAPGLATRHADGVGDPLSDLAPPASDLRLSAPVFTQTLEAATARHAAPYGNAPAEAAVALREGRFGADIGVTIARALDTVRDGRREDLLIRLDPRHMGRVEVRMSFEHDGVLRAVVSADSPAALDMLRRESADLGRALTDAGVRADAQSLRFDGGGTGSGQRHGARPQAAAAARSDGAGNLVEDSLHRPLRSSGHVDLMA